MPGQAAQKNLNNIFCRSTALRQHTGPSGLNISMMPRAARGVNIYQIPKVIPIYQTTLTNTWTSPGVLSAAHLLPLRKCPTETVGRRPPLGGSTSPCQQKKALICSTPPPLLPPSAPALHYTDIQGCAEKCPVLLGTSPARPGYAG